MQGPNSAVSYSSHALLIRMPLRILLHLNDNGQGVTVRMTTAQACTGLCQSIWDDYTACECPALRCMHACMPLPVATALLAPPSMHDALCSANPSTLPHWPWACHVLRREMAASPHVTTPPGATGASMSSRAVASTAVPAVPAAALFFLPEPLAAAPSCHSYRLCSRSAARARADHHHHHHHHPCQTQKHH